MIEQQIILNVVPTDFALQNINLNVEFDIEAFGTEDLNNFFESEDGTQQYIKDYFGYTENIINLNALFDPIKQVFTDEQGKLFGSEDSTNIYNNEQ